MLHDGEVLQQLPLNLHGRPGDQPLARGTQSWRLLAILQNRFLENHGATWFEAHIQHGEYLDDRLIAYITQGPISKEAVVFRVSDILADVPQVCRYEFPLPIKRDVAECWFEVNHVNDAKSFLQDVPIS